MTSSVLINQRLAQLPPEMFSPSADGNLMQKPTMRRTKGFEAFSPKQDVLIKPSTRSSGNSAEEKVERWEKPKGTKYPPRKQCPPDMTGMTHV